MAKDATGKDVHPLVSFAIGRRVTMGMLLLGVLVLGVLALQRLPLEFLPAISSSNISVTAPYPSSSPEEVALRIIQPLEDTFGTLNHLDRLSSRSSAEEGRIDLTFVDGTDMDLAAVEVRDRIDRVRHRLPSDLRQLRVRRFQSSDLPVLRFHVSAPWSQDRLYDFVERVLQRRLERLPGVAQIDVRGLRSREVQIRLDADRMAAHGVDLRQLSGRLQAGHLNLSAGYVVAGGRKLIVRCMGELTTLEEIRELLLDDRGLRLGDVAEVAYTFPTQERYNFLNGVESLTVRVYKASSANLLEVADRVKAELAVLVEEPEAAGLASRIYRDASVDVRQGLQQLRDAGLLGGGLAILAVFLFLRRVRTTILIGVAIPVSVVLTFVLMFLLRQAGWSDLTLNVISLMGLVLALGMLVDNAIVVIESVYRHIEELGEDARTAALHGTSEVALPILASTATTLCVFIPVIFLRNSGGFFSRYLVEVGTTVCIVMVASLLVALTVVPMAAAFLLARERPRPTPLFSALGRGYGAVLRTTLRFRPVFLVLSAAALYGSWLLFGSIERSFGTHSFERQVSINVDTPRSFGRAETAALFEEVAGILDAKRDTLDIADITYSYDASSGRVRTGWNRGKRFEIYLVDESEAELTTSEARDRIRALLPERPGIDLRIAQSTHRHGGSGLQVELVGEDAGVLAYLGRDVAARLAEVPGIRDVDLSLESGDDEVRLAVARTRAARAGLSSGEVARTVQSALSGRATSYLKTDRGDVDLIMQYREADRETLGQLRNVPVHTAGTTLPLDTLADFTVTPGPRSLERENRLAKLSITANTASPREAGRAMGGIGMVMRSVSMPTGYSWSFGRWNRMHQRDQAGAGFALLFAFLLVYMLMAALFESFTQPLAIMISVPFAFIGVGLVMKLAATPRDNFTELGFIILVGVVVNNAIVLIDRINRLRRRGMERDEAILEGGRNRLRAILMTAITTILGLLPMVAPILLPQWFGPLEGRAATWAPVGLVILGGLTTSTFLTLLILPTFYSIIDDIAGFVGRVARAAVQPRRQAVPSHDLR